jgi:hypothetical protein
MGRAVCAVYRSGSTVTSPTIGGSNYLSGVPLGFARRAPSAVLATPDEILLISREGFTYWPINSRSEFAKRVSICWAPRAVQAYDAARQTAGGAGGVTAGAGRDRRPRHSLQAVADERGVGAPSRTSRGTSSRGCGYQLSPFRRGGFNRQCTHDGIESRPTGLSRWLRKSGIDGHHGAEVGGILLDAWIQCFDLAVHFEAALLPVVARGRPQTSTQAWPAPWRSWSVLSPSFR